VVSRVVRAQRTCPQCETRLQSVLDTKMMGCPACYVQFADEIPALAAKLHEAQVHRGKAPHQTDARTQLRTDLQSKRTLLRSVLKSENYEAAAQLRDEIRVLESDMYASGPGAN
jgi:protein arginine kinase activator